MKYSSRYQLLYVSALEYTTSHALSDEIPLDYIHRGRCLNKYCIQNVKSFESLLE